MQKFTLKTNNVNSNIILKEVNDFISHIILDFNVIWDNTSQRDSILDVLDAHFEDMTKEGKVSQWNVICDGRNNAKTSVIAKITHLDITYKQRNCYNTTKLEYLITRH